MSVLAPATHGVEILDRPGADPALVRTMLRDIARANRWFGGVAAVKAGLRELLPPSTRGRHFTLLDVGTGGGVPGVILAILRPDLEVQLCESMAKKARAVDEIVKEAGLKLKVHHARAEALLEEHNFDTLVVRAVAPLAKLLRWFAPHWDSFSRLLVIKGPAWVDERHEAREAGLLKQLELRKINEYPLPGTESNSVILSIRPKDQA